MIDIHCHILPGIDDGAVDMAASLELIEAAIADGITHLVCTPHIQLGRFDNNIDSIAQTFKVLKESVDALSLDIALSYAAEVRICPEIMILHKQNKLPFLGKWQNMDVLLLELPHSHVPAGTEQLVKWLLKNKILPLIAHPERNRDILADYNKFTQLQRIGCIFQLTAASLCGDFGEGPQQLAEKLIEEDGIKVIATDAHSLKRRPPNLMKGKLAAAKIVGEQRAKALVYDNPKLITENKFNVI